MAKTVNPTLIRTQKELADNVGRDPGTITRWLARDDWPFGKAPWPRSILVEVVKWAASRLETDPAAESRGSSTGDDDDLPDDADVDIDSLLKRINNPKDRIKFSAVAERMAKVKVEREMLVGGLVRKEDIERERVERIQAVKAELSTIRILALRLEGKTLQEREAMLDEWARGVCWKFENAN